MRLPAARETITRHAFPFNLAGSAISSLEKIFKAYDIRGKYPGEIDEEAAYRIGLTSPVLFPRGPIGVSRDMRLSAPAIKKALISGLLAAGINVVDLGVLSTCMHYFAVGKYGYAGGIQITASHNPPEYIGMKFVGPGSIPIAYENGLNRLREGMSSPPRQRKEGTLSTRGSTAADYGRHIRSLVGEIAPFPIVVDCGNGMGGLEFPAVFQDLPLQVDLFNEELDGAFPHHSPNPLLEESRRELVERVRAGRAAAGFIFDGDADRTAVVDETGEFIPNDFLAALLAGYYLSRYPGATIVMDFRSSRAVAEYIRQKGGVMISSRVGHSYIKGKMREADAVFGGDIAGHYYFRENYFSESSSLTTARLLEILTAAGKPLSELWHPLRKYCSTGEINYEVPDKDAAVREIAREFREDCGEPDYLDGVTIRCPDFWLNVRPSNTEPVVRFMAETEKRDKLDEIRDRVERSLGVRKP